MTDLSSLLLRLSGLSENALFEAVQYVEFILIKLLCNYLK